MEVDSASRRGAGQEKRAGQTEEKSGFNPRGAGLGFRGGVKIEGRGQVPARRDSSQWVGVELEVGTT